MLLSTIYGQVENNNAFAVTTISKGNMSISNCSFFPCGCFQFDVIESLSLHDDKKCNNTHLKHKINQV